MGDLDIIILFFILDAVGIVIFIVIFIILMLLDRICHNCGAFTKYSYPDYPFCDNCIREKSPFDEVY